MKILLILTILVSLFLKFDETSFKTTTNGDKDLISVFPKEYTKAFPNPLKGFRSSTIEPENYPTLTRLYIKWNEIENSENDGVEKIQKYCNILWSKLPGRNVKIIPRVYLEWPYGKQDTGNTRDTVTSDWGDVRYCERYWPSDMIRGDYTSEQFKKRLTRLIAKMGKAWDNDARVAYIEMGLIGWWGEQHSPFINKDMQKLMGDAFAAAFKTKLVMVRQAKDFEGYTFGSYWDSFAHSSQLDEADMLVAQDGKWKTTVRGGEVAYDWGDMSKTGTSPDQSLKVKANRDYIIDFIRKVHCNHLGWINNYNTEDAEVRQGAEEVQKALGYRFVLDEVSYTPDVLPGSMLNVIFKVRNTGSSPFYYNWPVEVSLLNPLSKQVMWKSVFKGTDIRTWLPGDKWDTVLRKYTIAPGTNTVHGVFKLPGYLKKGEYILALSILDPSGNVPAVRFAIQNYFERGRHPMGKIGVGKTLKTFTPDEKIFDDLYNDRTLYYDYTIQ